MIKLLRNRKFRDFGLQALFIGLFAFVLVGGSVNARENLIRQGLASGFDFLHRSTGWDLNFSLVPSSPYDPYWWYLFIGITNTLFMGTIGLILATIVGSVIGLMRSSSNDLARLLGTSYVEIFRNIPLLLQLVFWYAIFTNLPGPRQAPEFAGILLTNRGLYVPWLNISGWSVAAAFAVIFIGLFVATKVSKHNAVRVVLPLSVVAFAAVILAGRTPGTELVNSPILQGLNIRGGLRLPSEIAAMGTAIAIYGGAYIAEIVRGGFKAVGQGQIEAGRAVGLSEWHVFSRIRVPLALRAMLPILANQYIWLIKATTLGIVIGFNDFFMVIALMITHSGQTIEAVLILMAGFLAINFTIATIFNKINSAIALKGNQSRG